MANLLSWLFGVPAHDYGPPKWSDMSGPSIYEQMRKVIASPLAQGQKNQTPIVKFATHDTAKLNARKP
jgi:hypothetical protein